jgi:hypothetical protein
VESIAFRRFENSPAFGGKQAAGYQLSAVGSPSIDAPDEGLREALLMAIFLISLHLLDIKAVEKWA